MSSLVARKQLSLFSERLPRKPYCTNDLGAGLFIRPLKKALEQRYIQYNPPAMINWLVYDIDRPYPGFDNEWRMVAPPNIVVINPKNQRSHYLYGIAAGVSTTSASREKPRRLLSAIDEGYRHALDADPGFARLICKNPLNNYWNVELLREDLYDLSELAEYVDLDAAVKRIRSTPREHRSGLGRNCSLFDSLRTWAYRWVGEYGNHGFDKWHQEVSAQADKLNVFTDPLPLSEVRATAKSVAKWTWNKYTGQKSAASLLDDNLTPESFSLLQSNLGKMGNAKRWGDNTEKRRQALQMHSEGKTYREISSALSVSLGSLSSWLK